MWKIDFYLLPSQNYYDIDENEAYEFGERTEFLHRNEKVYIPNEFYDIPDQNSMTAMDFLYGEAQNDISDYLMDIISKQNMILYLEVIMVI